VAIVLHLVMFTHKSELWLPRPVDEVFPFFADAFNLERITPSWLRFQVLTPGPIRMGEGILIDYRLRVHGVPMRWRTRINAWEPMRRFVDEQLRGPYRQWIHEHAFEPRDGGTLTRDVVHYDVWGGRLIQTIFVRRDVERIFAYREKRLREIFS
jgi:ligand-binding SRPBCC domain-containing protein